MKFIKIISVLLFIPFTLLLKMISPIIKVRWAKEYFGDRIGHLVAEMEHYLFLTKKKSLFIIDIFPKTIFFNSDPSNKFLQTHYRKRIVTINDKIVILLQRSQKVLENIFKTSLFENLDFLLSTKDNHKIYTKNFKPTISFTGDEIKKIRESLHKIGIRKNQKFICLIVRDNLYLKRRMNFDTSYHDYRDCNIDNFKTAVNYLLKKNYFVLRMGKLQKNKMQLKNKNFLDYAFSNYKSDILDVWLMANCEFCISTGTGFDQISRIFNRPVLYLNQIPLIDWSSYSKSFTHPKFLFKKKVGKVSKIEDYLKFSFHRKLDYKKKNLNVIDLSKGEILDCVKEFLKILANNWHVSKSKRKKQKKFNKEFTKYLNHFHPKVDFHKKIHKHALISDNFLNSLKI